MPDADTTICDFRTGTQPAGTYDDELLGAHFITGDGRGNENIALSMVHQIFHAEHNRLAADIDRRINSLLTPAEIAAWHAVDAGSGWDYGERLFQAARFGTEMQYQHLVFEEFARTMQPLINPFLGGLTSINPAISAEFAHTVYRLGHSMLPEVLTRIDAVTASRRRTTSGCSRRSSRRRSTTTALGGATLNAAQAAGSLVRGMSREVGNELDEFITDSVRNTLVGLPLDLAGNQHRARTQRRHSRAERRPPAVVHGHSRRGPQAVRELVRVRPEPEAQRIAGQLRRGLRHRPDDHQRDDGGRQARGGGDVVVAADRAVHVPAGATSGLDNVDFWVGGLAERQAVFGGLLGSTFNFVFEKQLENLQDGDRFYYLQRTDGLNFRFQLEGNSFAELIRRNTDFSGGMDVIFHTADFIFNSTDPALNRRRRSTSATACQI